MFKTGDIVGCGLLMSRNYLVSEVNPYGAILNLTLIKTYNYDLRIVGNSYEPSSFDLHRQQQIYFVIGSSEVEFKKHRLTTIFK